MASIKPFDPPIDNVQYYRAAIASMIFEEAVAARDGDGPLLRGLRKVRYHHCVDMETMLHRVYFSMPRVNRRSESAHATKNRRQPWFSRPSDAVSGPLLRQTCCKHAVTPQECFAANRVLSHCPYCMTAEAGVTRPLVAFYVPGLVELYMFAMSAGYDREHPMLVNTSVVAWAYTIFISNESELAEVPCTLPCERRVPVPVEFPHHASPDYMFTQNRGLQTPPRHRRPLIIPDAPSRPNRPLGVPYNDFVSARLLLDSPSPVAKPKRTRLNRWDDHLHSICPEMMMFEDSKEYLLRAPLASSDHDWLSLLASKSQVRFTVQAHQLGIVVGASVPEHRYYKPDDCAVCYEKPTEPAVTQCCNKVFCFDCYIKWQGDACNRSCPHCRCMPFVLNVGM